jgi:hypothetical protein
VGGRSQQVLQQLAPWLVRAQNVVRSLRGSRRCRRDEVLGTTVKDFREFGEVLAAVRDKGQVVAVTSGEMATGGGACGRAGGV